MTILELLKIYFSKLCNGKDTRQPKKCHYLMENLLIIMELAILAGYDTTKSVTSFVDTQIDVLTKVGLIENNELPDENTYYRTLQMIPWETLKSLSNRIYSNLPKRIQERIKKNGISVVIDGQFIRGNKTRTKFQH